MTGGTASVSTTDPPPGRAPGQPARTRRGPLPALTLLVGFVTLGVSALAPMTTLVLGLVFFGVLAATLSTRYLLGRFTGLLDPTFVRVEAALVTGVVVATLLVGPLGRPAQLVATTLSYAVAAVAVGRWHHRTRRVVAWVVLTAALTASLAWPAYHLAVATHLLTLTPLGFVWEWSRDLTARPRRAFRAAAVTAYAGGPLLLLSGVLDPWLSAASGRVRSVVGDGGAVLAATTLPGTAGSPLAARLLATAAFLTTLGYAVWVVLLPRVAPAASAAVEARLPWATGPRVWAGAFTAAAGLAVVFALDFSHAVLALGAISAYPLLGGAALLVVLTGSPRGDHDEAVEKVLPTPGDRTYGRITEPEGRWSEK
ncbi:MAG: hypothetical protein JWP82_142 [Humibacillus sp.]|nr:hypothetical protein [Humibacillus sp.]